MKPALFILCLFSVAVINAQPGKFAGTKKSMIGKTFTNSDSIRGLAGWTQLQGSLMNKTTDPEFLFVFVFKKGTTNLALFTVMDTASGKHEILDLIELTGVPKGWTIMTGDCTRGGQADSYIIAWGKNTGDMYVKVFKKAWRFNPDKRRVEAIPVKSIICENIGC